MTWLNESPKIGRLFSDKLIFLLGEARKEGQELDSRFQDIAASLQAMYEEAFFHILNHLYQKTESENLALSGGCSQNSLANGKIYANTPFKNIYVPPAGHDAGGAIGAAFYLWNQVLGNPRKFMMNHAYWGPEFSREEIKAALEDNQIKYQELKDEELFKKTAESIAAGKIVGWFQGRTEWGPRALGNRSILVDPRRKEIKDILNERIKKREWFRPFAPSVLEEKTGEWFHERRSAPFMEKVYAIRPEKRGFIPAVTHTDGTGRLQTVDSAVNPRYHALIKEFEAQTGVPIVLNTSFNENEPIVNTPQDAINCFNKVGMDVLVLGNLIIAL
jgi:carbamoyltransferase